MVAPGRRIGKLELEREHRSVENILLVKRYRCQPLEEANAESGGVLIARE